MHLSYIVTAMTTHHGSTSSARMSAGTIEFVVRNSTPPATLTASSSEATTRNEHALAPVDRGFGAWSFVNLDFSVD
jgi:hypothetical protein